MKIGIISDTHDNIKNTEKAVRVFKDSGVEYVLHAGDIISTRTAMLFSELKAKFIAVYGNCDHDEALRAVIESFGGEIHRKHAKLNFDGREIYMTHIPRRIDMLNKRSDADLIIYGHTHKRDIRWVDDTLIVNPGECSERYQGSKSVVIVELENMQYDVIELGHVECRHE